MAPPAISRISPSALSQVIRQLEARLGTRLLDRTTRSVAPTAAGQRLYERFRPAVADLEDAVAEAKSSEGRIGGALRINLPRSAVAAVVAPILGRFHRDNPGIVLDLVVQETLVDIVADRFDAGIRWGESIAKDMISLPISDDIRWFAVASPDYLRCRGTPDSPMDLKDHDCLNWRWPTAGTVFRWPFERGGMKLEIDVEGPLIAYDAELMLEGALQGLGVAYTWNARIPALIEQGRLVRILETWSPRATGFHLYYPDRRYPRPALRAFIDALVKRHHGLV